MSYDLAIWHGTRDLSSEEAELEFANLCQADATLVHPNARLEAFVNQLTKKYPKLDDLPEDRLDESPWTSGFDTLENFCHLPIAWSRIEEVVPYTIKLALQHGLTCLDPQSGRVYQPKGLKKAT